MSKSKCQTENNVNFQQPTDSFTAEDEKGSTTITTSTLESAFKNGDIQALNKTYEQIRETKKIIVKEPGWSKFDLNSKQMYSDKFVQKLVQADQVQENGCTCNCKTGKVRRPKMIPKIKFIPSNMLMYEALKVDEMFENLLIKSNQNDGTKSNNPEKLADLVKTAGKMIVPVVVKNEKSKEQQHPTTSPTPTTPTPTSSEMAPTSPNPPKVKTKLNKKGKGKKSKVKV